MTSPSCLAATRTYGTLRSVVGLGIATVASVPAFLVYFPFIQVFTRCSSLFKMIKCSISGGQGGSALRCLRRVGATGKAGALPLHVGHQSQQQQEGALHQSLPLRPGLPPARGQGRRPPPGPWPHGPGGAGEAGLWTLHQWSLGNLL